ncbi:uncharacterized protein LOC110683100 [Chenopodium quinoa]|uniref:uncharacterized protein LOC110683100 n=1 Tax=Chenopodium quinoa TaxID=63459 RepID=UPI000B76DB39|nr:uncharacterized protein LOC110683100 [Chenopodium quinoa]
MGEGSSRPEPEDHPNINSYGFDTDIVGVVNALKEIGQPIRTDESNGLKREVGRLLKNSYLKDFLSKKGKGSEVKREALQSPPASPSPNVVIGAISEGYNISGMTYSNAKKIARVGMSASSIPQTYPSREEKVLDEMKIIFDERRFNEPEHHDCLVISLHVGHCKMKRVLVDNGSSTNIIFRNALNQAGFRESDINKRSTVLVGFNGEAMNPLGEIQLPTFLKGVNTMHKIYAVDSLGHLDELQLDEVVLDESKPDQIVKIGAALPADQKEAIIKCLRENSDCFAWSHQDMKGISPEVITHKLNVDPSMKPVKQKRRKFAPERNQIINEEVKKLLDTGKIREVKYPDWLANVVVVSKKNGTWRVCIDFTYLNKACPKDPFPLPHIDSMVDATAGHKLLTFMDAYSGYNQILMHQDDQEKTAFVTDKGIYYYKVMPFGLKNAGSTYQRLVNKMFKDQLGDTMEVYIDDMLVKSKKVADQLDHLNEAFGVLRKYEMKLNLSKCSFGVYAGKFLGFVVTQRGIEASPDQVLRDLKLYLTSPPLLSEPAEGESLQLYLAVGTQALGLALIEAYKNLRHYFETYPIVVKTNYPFKVVLRRPELTGRMSKWAIELSGFDIKYEPRTTIKSQALDDFVADFSPDLEQQAAQEVKQITQIADPGTWTLYVDGSSNFRGAGLGVVLKSPQGDMMVQSICCNFKATDNEVEYEALIAGMNLARNLGASELQVFYNQTSKPINPDFAKPEPNSSKIPKPAPSKPVKDYIEEDRYEKILKDFHDGECGAHSGGRTLANRILTYDYYWPTTRNDAHKYVSKCDNCQRNSGITHKPSEPLHPTLTPWPFMRWGMDIVDKLPPAPGQKVYMLALKDYFSKWKEKEKEVINFIWTNIICRFGVPSEIICDNGSQFISAPTRHFVINGTSLLLPQCPDIHKQMDKLNLATK